MSLIFYVPPNPLRSKKAYSRHRDILMVYSNLCGILESVPSIPGQNVWDVFEPFLSNSFVVYYEYTGQATLHFEPNLSNVLTHLD